MHTHRCVLINGNRDVKFLIGIIGHCTDERNLLYPKNYAPKSFDLLKKEPDLSAEVPPLKNTLKFKRGNIKMLILFFEFT